MNFKVGDMVIVTDGKNSEISRIQGVRRGHLRVGCLLFDWCGKEVDVVESRYRIYPLKEEGAEINI